MNSPTASFGRFFDTKRGTMLSKSQLISLIKQAVAEFYSKDAVLLKIRGLERTCASRIAIYLQELISKERGCKKIYVDCEYGKAADKDGVFLNKQLKGQGIRFAEQYKGQVFPDLIVHERASHRRNLMVIEIKGAWHEHVSCWEHDHKKLQAFTRQTLETATEASEYFDYKLGVFLMLGLTKPHYAFYENGAIVQGKEPKELFKQRNKR